MCSGETSIPEQYERNIQQLSFPGSELHLSPPQTSMTTASFIASISDPMIVPSGEQLSFSEQQKSDLFEKTLRNTLEQSGALPNIMVSRGYLDQKQKAQQAQACKWTIRNKLLNKIIHRQLKVVMDKVEQLMDFRLILITVNLSMEIIKISLVLKIVESFKTL